MLKLILCCSFHLFVAHMAQYKTATGGLRGDGKKKYVHFTQHRIFADSQSDESIMGIVRFFQLNLIKL